MPLGEVPFGRVPRVDCGRSLRERAPLPSEATEAKFRMSQDSKRFSAAI